jgi:hypothetical protein
LDDRRPLRSGTSRLPAGPYPLRRDLRSTSICSLLIEEHQCRLDTLVASKLRARQTDSGAGGRPSRPSVGRVSIEIMDLKPCSNKRSDGWCSTTISSSSAVRNPVANGRPERAFLGAVPNAVVFGTVGHRRSTLHSLRALFPGDPSQRNPSRSPSRPLLVGAGPRKVRDIAMLVSVEGACPPRPPTVPKRCTQWFRCGRPSSFSAMLCYA